MRLTICPVLHFTLAISVLNPSVYERLRSNFADVIPQIWQKWNIDDRYPSLINEYIWDYGAKMFNRRKFTLHLDTHVDPFEEWLQDLTLMWIWLHFIYWHTPIFDWWDLIWIMLGFVSRIFFIDTFFNGKWGICNSFTLTLMAFYIYFVLVRRYVFEINIDWKMTGGKIISYHKHLHFNDKSNAFEEITR